MTISFNERRAAKLVQEQRAAEIGASARRTIDTERAGLVALADAFEAGLAEPFAAAVEILDKATRPDSATGAPRGRAVVSGLGKSGHIGHKITATLASTGTPAFFIHPAEAGHGDLGMVTGGDVVLAISWSGETTELRPIVEFSRRFGNPLIALTSRRDSSLSRQADITLTLPQAEEACPHGLAPTTSAIMQLALGDALAIALLETRGFTAENFHRFHPGGRLGAKLNLVRDIMHSGNALPVARLGTAMSEAIVHMTGKGFGCLGVIEPNGGLVGIITDGDLRRNLGPDLMTRTVDEVMTSAPKMVAPDMLVGAVLDVLNQEKITAIFIVEGDKPIGIVHMHDLLRIGVA